MGCGVSNRNDIVNPDVHVAYTGRPEDERIMYDEDIDKETNKKTLKGNSKVNTKEEKEQKIGSFIFEGPSQGDQMLAIKPWLGALKPPSAVVHLDKSIPSISLEIEYVYGYRCFDSRNNVFYTRNTDEIVYMTAALGIVLNKRSNTQKVFGGGLSSSSHGHIDDITALAIHPNKDFVATGEVGKNPKICVWKATDPSSSCVEFCQGRDSRAVACLGFSYDGKYLASADLHNDHNVRVWEWEKSTLLYTLKGGPDRILDLTWNNKSYGFCTAGVKNIDFWRYEEAKLVKKRGIFGTAGNMCNMTSISYLNDFCLTGGTNGQVYKWSENQCIRTYQIHSSGSTIHSLNVISSKVLTGAKDNTIKVLNSSMIIIRTIQMQSFARALDMFNDIILCGNRDGSIIEVMPDDQKVVLMQSHCDGEVWGLCVNANNDDIMVTVGDDNYIKVWDMVAKKCINSKELELEPGPPRKAGEGASTLATNSPNQQARAVCINVESQHVAIGHNDGHVSILENTSSLSLIKKLKDPKEWIESIAYSPDSASLAVGSHDNYIYIYDASQYLLKHRLQGHSSFIIALDWSTDSQYLHSNCGAYELLFWNANNGKQLKSGATSLRDEVWATWTAKLGWPAQGVYEGVIDMTHVNTVDRSPNLKYLSAGNDWGHVAIFNYPCAEGTKSKSYKGHSEHVTNVKWALNNNFLLSTGGYDQTIIQWKITK
jgi:WD40 repeat protein